MSERERERGRGRERGEFGRASGQRAASRRSLLPWREARRVLPKPWSLAVPSSPPPWDHEGRGRGGLLLLRRRSRKADRTGRPFFRSPTRCGVLNGPPPPPPSPRDQRPPQPPWALRTNERRRSRYLFISIYRSHYRSHYRTHYTSRDRSHSLSIGLTVHQPAIYPSISRSAEVSHSGARFSSPRRRRRRRRLREGEEKDVPQTVLAVDVFCYLLRSWAWLLVCRLCGRPSPPRRRLSWALAVGLKAMM